MIVPEGIVKGEKRTRIKRPKLVDDIKREDIKKQGESYRQWCAALSNWWKTMVI